ncbi:MAG: transcription-repair coupling factor [Phycisphaerae bacterium]
MFERALNNETLRTAVERLATGRRLRIGGVWGSAAPMAAAALGRLRDAPVLLVARHLDDADDLADDVEVLTGRSAQLLPAWEVDVGGEHVNDEVTGERLRVCNLLAREPERRDEPADVIVAPIMALLQPVPSPESLAEGRLTLRAGAELDPDALTARLVDAGFEQVEQVEQQSDFARRGGIVDVFPPGATQAVRVEFFGDEIESVRLFDLDTQRSTVEVQDYDLLARPADANGFDAMLTDYLPSETIVCVVEPEEVFSLAEEMHRRIRDDHREDHIGMFEPSDVSDRLRRFAGVEMHTFPPHGDDVINLGIRSIQRLSTNTNEALKELADLSASAELWVFCENAAEQKRFEELVQSQRPELAGRVRTALGHLHAGFYWPGEQLAAVAHHEIFHRYAKVRRIRRVRAGRPIESLLDLTEGDYVVHVAHGIARFEGLRRLESEGRSEEFLRLRFADGAVLHVPAGHINLVQKYIGSRGKRPTLSKLGSATWSRQKQRVKEAVRDLAAEMLRIQAVRRAMPGVSYPAETDWQKRFRQEFIYTETEDQLAACLQIDEDMAAARPMDRLLCGDVGYGKTELAMRAAFKVAEAGKQTAVLVPTTVLADQHYRTFRERMADYPFEIEVLSRFRSPAEQKRIIERLGEGKVDVIIGTHRLLSGDVRFADLGLVVVDEEQRFGVTHKEHLKRMRTSVDVLTMTATPIPRTLHMALLGLRDISSLSTPPLDRRAIETRICRNDDELIRRAVHHEMNRGGQVFFVHNRVFNIGPLARHVESLVPDASVAVAHGQMGERELADTMLRFVRGEIDVLVCTTIIESGLDIPSANTIIIHNADRFGLAELHQLRGRVGRYKHKAYCYLLLPGDRPVSPTAARRLKAVEEFSDLGAGFQIAMRDLEIRGAGNILGAEQSGHIATVGYEMYCRLLEESVRELKGEPSLPKADAHVELGVDAYIPRSYVPSDRQRMELYRRLADCREVEQLKQLSADLRDAYGPVPELARTLLDLAEARVRAAALGIESIIRSDPDLVFTVEDISAVGPLFEDAPGTARMPDDKTVHWRLPENYREMPTLLRVLLYRLARAGAGAEVG